MTFLWFGSVGATTPQSSAPSIENKVQASEPLTKAHDIDDDIEELSQRHNPGVLSRNKKSYPEQKAANTLLAKHIMSQPVESLSANTSLGQLQQKFLETRYRHFPIIDHANKPIGIVSDRDMFRKLASGDWHEQQKSMAVATLMQEKVLTATADTPVREIAKIFFTQRVGAMPVIDAQHKLIGMITRSDVLRVIDYYLPVDSWI